MPDRRLTVPDVLYVDNSTLSSLHCSTQALLRYGHGLRAVGDERAYLLAGTAIHLADETWFRGGSRDAAMKALTDAYEPWASEHVPDTRDRLSYPNVARVYGQWLDTHALSTLPYQVKPDLIEIGFALPLVPDGSIVFTGRLDSLVDDLTTNHVYVRERKTTGALDAKWVRQWRTASQLTGYTWAAQQTIGTGTQVAGVMIDGIELSRLPDSARKCKDHGVLYAECGVLHATFLLTLVQRTPEQLAEWQRTAIHLAKRYRDLLTRFPALRQLPQVRQQGTFVYGACTSCEFQDFCSVGRPLDRVTSMLTHDPWSPFDHAMTRTLGDGLLAHVPV